MIFKHMHSQSKTINAQQMLSTKNESTLNEGKRSQTCYKMRRKYNITK